LTLLYQQRLKAERDLARAAEQLARSESDRAREISEFLLRTFAQANPENNVMGQLPRVDVLLKGAVQDLIVQSKFRPQKEIANPARKTLEPSVRAQLLLTLGKSLLQLGEYRSANDALRTARDLGHTLVHAAQVQEVDSKFTNIQQAEVLRELSRTQRQLLQYADAHVSIDSAFALIGKAGSDKLRMQLWNSRSALFLTERRFGDAENAARKTLQLPDGGDPELKSLQMGARTNLATALHSLGKREEVLALRELIWKQLESINGAQDTDTFSAQMAYAIALADIGRASEALPIAESAYTQQLDYGERADAYDSQAARFFAEVLRKNQRWIEAQQKLEQSLEIAQTLGTEFGQFLALYELSALALDRQQTEAAQLHYERAKVLLEKMITASNPNTSQQELLALMEKAIKGQQGDRTACSQFEALTNKVSTSVPATDRQSQRLRPHACISVALKAGG
jgi:tetratricopeptide (TPR) repeat protein